MLNTTTALACKFSFVKSLSLFTSLESELTTAFDENRSLFEIPSIRAFECQKMALQRQFLMIGLGPEVNEFDDQVQSYSFSDEFYPSMCTIKNSPFPVLTFEEKLKLFKEKKQYFKSCIEFYVEDEGKIPMRLPADNPGCTVTKITSHKASFTGGFCFFQPNVTSSYLIKMRIRPECQSRSGMKDLGLTPMDIKGILNFYSAGDTSGQASNLSAIESTPLRLITNSDENVLSSSESYGQINPQFPDQYVAPEVHMGQASIEDIGGRRVRFTTPVLVDNRCGQKCADGLCYSPCKYAQPVVFEVRLKEIDHKRGKEHFLTSWYDGGVAQPDYQGFIRGVGFEIPSNYIEANKNYKLELHFYDPKFDFERFKNRIIRKFGRIQQQLPSMGRSTMPAIPEINDIMEIARFPEIREILGIDFENGMGNLKNEIALLRSYLGYKLWPPYYNEACTKDLSECKSISSSENRIEMSFKTGEVDNQKYKLSDIKIKKIGPFGKTEVFNEAPYLKCGYDI